MSILGVLGERGSAEWSDETSPPDPEAAQPEKVAVAVQPDP